MSTTTWNLKWVPDIAFYNNSEKPSRCYLASPLNNWQYEDPAYALHITGLFEYRGYDRTLPIFAIDIPNVPVGSPLPFKLIVDGQWYYDPRFPTTTDPLGNINNVITLNPA